MSAQLHQLQKTAASEEADKFYDRFHTDGFVGKATVERYNSWSKIYEKENSKIGYSHPVKIAQVAARYIEDKNCRVLDVCAGTGLGGQGLRDVGFTDIDALDGSEEMLAVAKGKNVYQNFYLELIGEEKLKTIDAGSYDAIVTSGSFVPGHLGPKQLRVLAEVLKPGGWFCMAMRAAFLATDFLQDLEPEMQRMENDGVWKKVAWETMENFYKNLDGNVYIYQKC